MTDRKKLLEDLMQNVETMRRRVFISGSAAKMHTSPAQWLAMRVVGRYRDCTVKMLAQELQVSSSAATQLIDKLVESRYVLRKENARDRRAVTLTLAPKAQKEIRLMKAQVQRRLSQAFKTLDDSELEEFVRLHRKLVDNSKRYEDKQ